MNIISVKDLRPADLIKCRIDYRNRNGPKYLYSSLTTLATLNINLIESLVTIIVIEKIKNYNCAALERVYVSMYNLCIVHTIEKGQCLIDSDDSFEVVCRY